MEQTLIILNPDSVQRRLSGRILQRFEDKGFTIAGRKLMQISRDLGERHYAPHKGKPFYPGLLDYMTSGPVVVQVLEGEDAVALNRRVMGATNPEEADEGTIRKTHAESLEANSAHGSDSAENAAIEIAQFFSDDQIVG